MKRMPQGIIMKGVEVWGQVTRGGSVPLDGGASSSPDLGRRETAEPLAAQTTSARLVPSSVFDT